MAEEVLRLRGRLTSQGTLRGKLSLPENTALPYEGEYEVTPTQYTQTLETEGRVLISNIVVNPIPHNYGLITWDGSKLTVS